MYPGQPPKEMVLHIEAIRRFCDRKRCQTPDVGTELRSYKGTTRAVKSCNRFLITRGSRESVLDAAGRRLQTRRPGVVSW